MTDFSKAVCAFIIAMLAIVSVVAVAVVNMGTDDNGDSVSNSRSNLYNTLPIGDPATMPTVFGNQHR